MLTYKSFPYVLNSDAKLWVVSVSWSDGGNLKTKSLVKEEITKDNLDDILIDFETIVTHNGLKFDLPALMVFGLIDYSIGYMGESDTINGRNVRFIDTHIMSRFINPDRLGGHSLKEWGKRTGTLKTDYRAELIKIGVIEPSSPKGYEFTFFHELMVEYCEGDTLTTAHTYKQILDEYKGYSTAKLGLQMEHKLADLAVRRELLGFKFDKKLALENLEFLTTKMEELSDNVNPLLPKKNLTQTDLSYYTPPIRQHKSDGTWTSHMVKFLEKLNITDHNESDKWFKYNGNIYETPHELPLETSKPATIDDLDVVKHELIRLGWEPTEWKDRDLTKDSKKQVLPMDKRIKAMDKWIKETLEGKYKEHRLKILGTTEDNVRSKLMKDLGGKWGVKVPTSPAIRVGVTKEMCPNLIELGDKVSFAKDVADYYTYRHRKGAIAGGDIEDMDFDEEVPQTGYLSQVREEDGRIPTPAIELGANTFRYKHIGVANIPRTTSLFGKEMRALFGSGEGYIQLGFDYASLEARIQGNYVFDYEGGEELAYSLLQEKPDDVHTVMSQKLGIDRGDAKSINYMFMYGGSATKLQKMMGYSRDYAVEFHKNWWDEMLPLKQLKEDKEREWVQSGKKFITGIDGRRLNIRSQHSIINALFQSAGVIFAKYVTVLMCKSFEDQGYCIDPLKGKPQISSMIEYHDEQQQIVDPKLVKFEKFSNEDDARDFVSSWTGGQLGAIQKGRDGYYVTLPNVVSESLTSCIKEVETMFNMKVEMGFEYVTGRNWRDCH